jgi:DNA-binding CsgD family transcriptional regulator
MVKVRHISAILLTWLDFWRSISEYLGVGYFDICRVRLFEGGVSGGVWEATMMLQNVSIGSEAEFHNSDHRLVSAIVLWCECLQGRGALRAALKQISVCIGSEAIALTRVPKAGDRQNRSMIYDRRSENINVGNLSRSYSGCVLGRYHLKPKVGTIWQKTNIEDDIDPVLENFQKRRNLSELVVIPLLVDGKFIDFIELHFERRLSEAQMEMLSVLASTLTSTWAKRANGLFSEFALERPVAPSDRSHSEPILSFRNPAGLSRAEYRICLLLSHGLSTKSLCSELTISASTLRSHLRSIYDKTHTTCRSELIFDLFTKQQSMHQEFNSSQVEGRS